MHSSFQRLEELIRQGIKLYPDGHFGVVRYNWRDEPIFDLGGALYVGQYISRFPDKGRETVYGPIREFAAKGGWAGILDILRRAKQHGPAKEYRFRRENWESLRYKRMAEILRKEGVEKIPSRGIMVEVRVLELPDERTYQYARPSIMHLDNYPRRESA